MPSLKASAQGLHRIKQTRKASAWAIDDEHWLLNASAILDNSTDWAALSAASKPIFAAGVSLSTWKRFLRGDAVTAAVFQAFCQVLELDWRSVIEAAVAPMPASPSVDPNRTACAYDWGEAPDVPLFVGRQQELATLEQWMVGEPDSHEGISSLTDRQPQRCRLIAILGLGGVGKTGLSIKLGSGGMGKTNLSLTVAHTLQDEFDCIIWRSLLNAPPLTTLLADWIKVLSQQQELLLPHTLEECLARLLHYLRTRRCLLILDNVETILQGGGLSGCYREGYEGYGQLLKQVGEVPHQSCLLLTSREKPKEVARLEGRYRPVRSLELGGLGVADGKHIFAEFGDFTGSEDDWRAVVNCYNGNPLALELAAKYIHDVYFGNLAAFLKQGKPVFHDLHDLLGWYLQQLSADELEVVYWLVIHREPVTIEQLHQDLLTPLQTQLPAILQSLQRRLTLKCNDDRFTLHPVLIDYFGDRLLHQLASEIMTGQERLLVRHALLLALAPDYVRDLQTRLLLHPLLDRLQAMLGDRAQVIQHLHQRLTAFQGKPFAHTGYAVGNGLNLLIALQADLSDRDFSNLVIAQADLSCAPLHRTNFTHCQFHRSAFAEQMSGIVSIAFSANGLLMATAESDGILRLWRVETGQTVLRWHAHANWINAAAFSPDDRLLASGGTDHVIHLWDATTGIHQRTLMGHTHWVKALAFSHDGRWLISGSDDRTLRLWDVATGACVQCLQGHTDSVYTIAVHPDGTLLASGSGDRTLRLWNLHTGACLTVLRGHTDGIGCASFNPDGQTLVSVSNDNTIRLWEVATGRCINIISSGSDKAITCAFDPTGTILATGGYDTVVRFWEARTGQCVQTLVGHLREVWAIAFNPTGTICATGGDDQTVRLWNVQTGQPLRTLQGYWDGVTALASVPASNTILSSHIDGMVRLWDLTTRTCVRTFQRHHSRVWAVAASPNGKLIASGGSDCTVRLWDISTGRCVKTIAGFSRWVWSVAFSPNGRYLASGSADNTVRLWDIETGICHFILEGHQGRVWSLAFSPDGETLVSAAQDGSVNCWQVATGQCLATLSNDSQRMWSASFSPDGHTLVCGNLDHTLSLWDAATRTRQQVLQGHTQDVLRVVFSPDGQWLASSSYDRTVRLWQVTPGQCVRVLQGHTNVVSAVLFSQDGQQIVSSSFDGTIQLWQAATGDRVATLRAPRPYEGMVISDVMGLSEAEAITLQLLGALP